jgi:hypothetical protein
VEAEGGKLEQAAYLIGAVTKADETQKLKMEFEHFYFHQPLLAELHVRLQDPVYQVALEQGRNTTLDRVAKEILESH